MNWAVREGAAVDGWEKQGVLEQKWRKPREKSE